MVAVAAKPDFMIISRTPYRLSFFGGGTDYPDWYRTHGGSVLATTLNKYCYISARYLPPFFEHRFRIVYSKTELCALSSEIKHPAVRGTLQHLKFTKGLEIHHDGDLPARSGIGSSSSFVVGLLHALYALRGEMRSKHDLALESIYIEQELLKETVGAQDQTLAAYGGFNVIHFHTSGEITVRPMTLPAERIVELNSHLMLFYTGIVRNSTDIASLYIPEIKNKQKQLFAYGPMVDEAQESLIKNRPMEEFGKLLHEAWLLKKSISAEISKASIDEIYEVARASGALGGKIIGAGGGGFLLLFAPPHTQANIRAKLKNLLEVPFEFENHGSQIIFYDPEAQFQDRPSLIPR